MKFVDKNIYNDVLAALTGIGCPLTADFPFIRFDEKKLHIHIVPLADYSQNPLQFQALSEDYEKRGIQLIHLWEDVWCTQRPLALSRLRSLLGEFVRIHARQTIVKTIDKPTLQAFLQANHLHGSPQAKYKYGLFHHGKLVAAASFSAVRPLPRNGVVYNSYELVRFANLAGHVVTGGLGKLLAQFIADVQPDDIMSYADRDWSVGRSYEKLNFSFIENTAPQLFYIHPQELVRYYPQRLPHGLSETDMLQRGYMCIYNAGNKKYLKLLK